MMLEKAYCERDPKNLPVLKMGYFPSFVFQKDSRWYSDHWGVVLMAMLGLLGSDIVNKMFWSEADLFDSIDGWCCWWWISEFRVYSRYGRYIYTCFSCYCQFRVLTMTMLFRITAATETPSNPEHAPVLKTESQLQLGWSKKRSHHDVHLTPARLILNPLGL